MLKRWQWIALAAVGVAAAGFAASFFSPAEYQVCAPNDYTHAKECTPYHFGPFVVLSLVAVADLHNGIVTAIATLAIAALTVALTRSAFVADRHFRVTERAYVKMSHCPPGVRWEGITGGKFTVTVRVRNHGRTPAEITDAILIHEVHDRATIIPEHPDYGQPKHKIPTTSFLVAEDEFIFTEYFEVSGADREEIDSGTKVLTILGYVDYIDRFGQRYRGGYARVYSPPTADENLAAGFSGVVSPRNNLVLFPNRKRNYDRLRLPGEGNDWDDNA